MKLNFGQVHATQFNNCKQPNSLQQENQQVKFGWSEKNPPEHYLFPLSQAHFSDFENLIPTDELVDEIVSQMRRDKNSLDKAGFVILTNTLGLMDNNPVKVRKFQKNLSDRVFEKLFPDQTYELNADEKVTYHSAKWALKDHQKGHLFNASATWQFPPHYDFYGTTASLISMAYGPFQDNFSEGGFRIMDHRAGEEELGYKVEQGNDVSKPSLSLKQVIEDFCLNFNDLDFTNDMPIVLVNNHYDGYGVAHGGLRPKLDRPGEHFSRPLHRIMYLREANNYGLF